MIDEGILRIGTDLYGVDGAVVSHVEDLRARLAASERGRNEAKARVELLESICDEATRW
jgi:hypothetical protein